MSERPPMAGLRHLALWIPDARFDATLAFYRDALGLRIDWQPDADNVYLSSGADNVALHRAQPERVIDHDRSPLDHFGFVLPSATAVSQWYDYFEADTERWSIEMLGAVKHHRDDSVSFYLRDPAGHIVQMIFIPNLAQAR